MPTRSTGDGQAMPARRRGYQERGGGESGESARETGSSERGRASITGDGANTIPGSACRKSGPGSADAETPSSPPRHFLTAMTGTSNRRGACSSPACGCSEKISSGVEQQPVPQQQETGFSTGAHGQIFAGTTPEATGFDMDTGTTNPPANCSTANTVSSSRAAGPLAIGRCFPEEFMESSCR